MYEKNQSNIYIRKFKLKIFIVFFKEIIEPFVNLPTPSID